MMKVTRRPMRPGETMFGGGAGVLTLYRPLAKAPQTSSKPAERQPAQVQDRPKPPAQQEAHGNADDVPPSSAASSREQAAHPQHQSDPSATKGDKDDDHTLGQR